MASKMAKRKQYSWSWWIITATAAAACSLVWRQLQASPEPQACAALRSFLENTYHVDSWYHEGVLDGQPKAARDFPFAPLQVLEACGAPSFRMPFPFRFRFDPAPASPEEIVEKLSALNKNVTTRPMSLNATEGRSTPFGLNKLTSHGQTVQSFKDAWECIAVGTCACYFDNTWTASDMNPLLPKNGLMDSLKSTLFGSVFLSNFAEHRFTAGIHAAPMKSIALQVTGHKVWHFLSPKVLKRAFIPTLVDATTLTTPIAHDDMTLLEALPRYTVHTRPGEGVYFPAFWSHIVETDAGVSLLSNFRQYMEPMEILFKSPHSFRNKVRLAVKATLSSYVIPERFQRLIISKSHDKAQKMRQGTRVFLDQLYLANR